MRLLRHRHDLACREVVELVTDYLEGVLDDRDRERFERHLGGCDGCAAYLEQMRVTLRVAGPLEAGGSASAAGGVAACATRRRHAPLSGSGGWWRSVLGPRSDEPRAPARIVRRDAR